MHVPLPLLTAAGILLLVLGFRIARGGDGGRDLIGPPAPLPVMSPALVDEVHRLLQRREKIEAIRRVREELGIGLKEAKDMVEALARTRYFPRGK